VKLLANYFIVIYTIDCIHKLKYQSFEVGDKVSEVASRGLNLGDLIICYGEFYMEIPSTKFDEP